MKRFILVGLACAGIVAVLSGCLFSGGRSTRRNSSSLVNFLYPKGMRAPDSPAIPTLQLPLRVGLAWVPEGDRATINSLSEKQRSDLLQSISPHFQTNSFIRSIEIIPSPYLTSGGGFANLEQLRTIYGVDVIALVSYDQVQFTDEGLLSLAYWTIVGAYTIQGEKNDTQTMLDTAVYDVASHKLLFRAPGTSRVKASSTPINLSEQLRADSQKGFEAASTNMVANLKTELVRFRTRVEQSPQEFNVVHAPGYTGGGAIGWFEATLILVLFSGWLLRVRVLYAWPPHRRLSPFEKS